MRDTLPDFGTLQSAMRIGSHVIEPPVILAPMAGVTDKPFRQLCRQFGAGLAVSEMTTADPRLWTTRKSRLRMDHADEPGPVSVQLAGTDPAVLAAAARHAADRGAAIVDLNMGCPAKKVCNVAAGSALLQDEPLVARILATVAAAVDIPVTLKMRTGYSRHQRNAVRIARLAEEAGIAAVAVHGRTRQDFFTGEAEYETVAAVKAAVRIPVIANGDLATPAKAVQVLRETGCDAVMLGRPALGRPWIFREVAHLLATGCLPPPPTAAEVAGTILRHVEALHAFYGEYLGVRIARKHLAWYCGDWPVGREFRQAVNPVATAPEQLAVVAGFLAASGPGAGEVARPAVAPA